MDARRLITTLSLCLGLAASAPARAAGREVPEALVPILNAAEKALASGEPRKALAFLARWDGPQDPLHQLLYGHARYESGALAEAEDAYERALALDPGLRIAATALARVRAEQRDWKGAIDVLSKIVDLDSSPAAEIGLYARAAFEAKDLRLASVLVERGIIRFPSDQSFRRLDIAILLERGALGEVEEAARTILGSTPSDRLAWRQLAAAKEGSANAEERLAALEAAVLVDASDERLVERHVLAQFQAGHVTHALALVRELLGNNPGRVSRERVELGVRIAESAGELRLARQWLSAVPDSKRTEAMHLIEARLAIREDDPRAGLDALDRIIARGIASADVFLWAAQLAERVNDPARAEALYRQAIDLEGAAGRLAVLHLARLLHRIDQPSRASQLLALYLSEHPEDAPARSLLAVISRVVTN